MMPFKWIYLLALLPLAISAPAFAQGSGVETIDNFFKFDVPYVPTPPEVVQAMLELADAGPDDIVYDLGSGDGRIVHAAVKDFGVKKGVGYDLDVELIDQARATAQREGIADRATFEVADIFKTSFDEATVLTLYLLHSINLDLRPRILDMEPGTRVVSHYFDMRDWIPDAAQTIEGRRIYMWKVPAKMGGRWSWTADGADYSLDLTQEFQEVSGLLQNAAGSVRIDGERVNGTSLSFTAQLPRGNARIPITFEGQASGDTMALKFTVNGTTHTVTAKRGS